MIPTISIAQLTLKHPLFSLLFAVHADADARPGRRRCSGGVRVLALTGRAAHLQRGAGAARRQAHSRARHRHEVLRNRHYPSQGMG